MVYTTMSSDTVKVEMDCETCAICGGTGGDLLSPEEHDAGAPPLQTPLRAMLLHLNNNKVIPEGRLCGGCIRRAVEAYEFSSALSGRTAQPLSDKIRALREKLHELTQKIDVFIVVGGAGGAGGAAYSEDDIIMVEREALAAVADRAGPERARDAAGQPGYQCSVCPLTFERVSDFHLHEATHPADARHSCWTCGAQFPTRGALQLHASEHAAAPLICHLCDTVCQSAASLRAHSLSCTPRCPACGLRAASRAALAAHAAAHPLMCGACFAQLDSRAALHAHALSHRQADRFVCGYDACILRFANRSDLMSHIRKCHSGPAPASAPAPAPAPAATACPHCPRTFGSAAAMKRHARVHRRDRQPSQENSWHAELEGGEGGEGDAEYLEMEALDELADRD